MPRTAKVLSSNLTRTFFQTGNNLFPIKLSVNDLSAYLLSAYLSYLGFFFLLRAFFKLLLVFD